MSDFSDWRRAQAGDKFLALPKDEDQPDPEDTPWQGLVEQQLVRMDGTLLVTFVVASYQRMAWLPPLGLDIVGPCAGRVRALPDGPWFVLAYFPQGYPGPAAPWPEDQEVSWEGQFSIETGVLME
jgi:hypothetical protein